VSADPAALRRALAEEIAASNPSLDAGLRAAVAAVPRELFLGEAVFRPGGTAWEPVRRAEAGEDAWLRMVYADRTWVTQVDGVDVADADGPVSGGPTSSATLPSLVARTLQVAELRPGQRVLEVGTGTGYSTAALCNHVGAGNAGNAGNIVSVEYDPGLAARAAGNLRAAGFAPTLVVGDGLQGCKEHADYDAIVATCAVRTLPPSWFWQLSDGGSITTTVSGWMHAAGLIRLVLDDEGIAHGRFTADTVTYMLARPHEQPPAPLFFRLDGDTRRTRLDPRLLEEWAGRFVAQLAAPSAELLTTGTGVALRDVATGSQAWTEPEGEHTTVHQHGPLRLWDQVEAALAQWQQAGAPPLTGFGMTATPFEQTVWIGSPAGPGWRLPV
jgi:methyltransferase of ATP-grasp peptide maturase system